MKKFLSRNIFIITLIILVAIAAIVIYKKDFSTTEKSTSKNQPIEKPQKATANDDIIYGNKNAPVTIIEYASLSCSHCADFANNIFPKIEKSYIDTGKVKYILRDFPLDAPSLRAAQLTRCAAPTQYMNFVKALFKTQSDWAFSKNFPEKLENIAKLGGMSGEEFHQCIANKNLENKIIANRLAAYKQFEISSTPTFLINGKKYVGGSDFEFFAAEIDKLLK